MRRILVAVTLLGIVGNTSGGAAAQRPASGRGGSRSASPAEQGAASVAAWPFSRNATTPSATSPGKRKMQRGVDEPVLSPFAPPPDPRRTAARSRSPSNRQLNPDPRRVTGATPTPPSTFGNSAGRSQRTRTNSRPQDKPLARSSDSSQPRALPPSDRGAYGEPRRVQPDPRALPSDRRARTSDQPVDQQTSREQLRAMQQERINRETAKWKSGQAKPKAGTPTPRVDRQPLPAVGSEQPSTEPADGPALFAPTNGE